MLRSSSRQSAKPTKSVTGSRPSSKKTKQRQTIKPKSKSLFSTFKKLGQVTPQEKPTPPTPQTATTTKTPPVAAKKAPPTTQPTPATPAPQASQTTTTPPPPPPLETVSTLPKSTHQVPDIITNDENTPPKTAILMLNMGGPKDPEETKSFLTNLFSDPMIINLGKFQWAGIRAAASRTPKVQKQYETIGGSPIAKWTDLQGKSLTSVLDIISPQTSPHKHYIGFRYANPLTQSALEQIKKDGVKRVVAFSQFPMYSCTTTGSSLNDLWDQAKDMGLDLDFSVIDRWHDDDNFHTAIAENIKNAIVSIPKEELSKTTILFSAHSVPLKTMNGGDQYPAEVSHTVEQTMVKLNKLMKNLSEQQNFDFETPSQQQPSSSPTTTTLAKSNPPKIPHMLCWQSKVGFLPWLKPSTATAIEKVKSLGFNQAIIVPVAFTSDHIETLHEIDIEYKELAHKNGIKLIRAESLNNSMFLTKAQAHIVKEHLDNNEIVRSHQYRIKCNECIQPDKCRSVLGYSPEELFNNQRTQKV